MTPKIIFMPHANIQYSQLSPEKRPWVIKNCYEKLFDLVMDNPYKIAFEASGKTIEDIAVMAPEVLDKLIFLVKEGKVESVASPYIHFMLSNIPPQLCLDSLKHSLDTWEKYVKVRPVVGWNPECGWASYLPEVYKEAGFQTLIMDADSFLLSFDEIREATGLTYDVQGHSNKNQLFKIEEFIKDKPEYLKYITNPSRASNGLQMIFRLDCMSNLLLWYLMNATEGVRDKKISEDDITQMYQAWKERIASSGSFIMPYAEDAEYIGSSAYFYVKQFNVARFFEPEPESIQRFKNILDSSLKAGYDMATPSEVIASSNIIDNNLIYQIENGVAWHGGTAKAWMNTEHALLLDPVCNSIFTGIKELSKWRNQSWDDLDEDMNIAMKALASAWVSDSRWPPAPTSPGRFNVRETISDLYTANEAIERSMKNSGFDKQKSIYSPKLMNTQIRLVEEKLMNMKYFGEE